MNQPTGKLAWGQAASYDAVDDRAVITAVTRNRLGLVWPTEVVAGAGLQIRVRGGWLGVASCDDGTSAVVGDRGDQVVDAVPGGASLAREDVIWCDTNPDEGTWVMSVIPAAAMIGRSGIMLAGITVPPNANLASEMNIVPANATLERRLIGHASQGNDQSQHNATTWAGAAGNNLATHAVDLEPGQWYRARVFANSVQLYAGAAGPREGRIGIGWRLGGQLPAASVPQQNAAFWFTAIGQVTHASCEWVFRHPPTAQRVSRIFDTRIWLLTAGTYVPGTAFNEGLTRQLTVEDMGS